MLFKRKSGRHDLNVRLPAPKAGALAKLSYAPFDLTANRLVQQSIHRRFVDTHLLELVHRAKCGAECNVVQSAVPEFNEEVLTGMNQLFEIPFEFMQKLQVAEARAEVAEFNAKQAGSANYWHERTSQS